ncbi:MAG: DUF3383 family protein, partial [Clostridia bacterium]|nr:DUF3383 family protein [Clostridia bacterium]
MAISQTKYVNIVSSLGGGSSVSQRELIGRVFTSNYLVSVDTVLEFGGGKTNALSAIGEYFGLTSAEYKFAEKYFSFSTAANTEPKKIGFAKYNAIPSNAMLISGKGLSLSVLQAITAGTLTVSVNGSAVELTGINLSSATSFADIATLLTTAFNGAVDSCSYDSSNERFIIADATSLSYATGTVAEAMKFVEGEAILTAASDQKSSLATVSDSAELSNNFFSFCFLETLSTTSITDLAAWTDSQNVKYMYSVGVTESSYSAVREAVKDYDGVALTYDSNSAN